MEILTPDIVKAHIKSEFWRGLTDDGCLGYHGLSLETLQYVLGHGVIPGETIVWREDIPHNDLGDVFYYPPFSDDVNSVTSYAATIAARHHFATLLGLSLSNLEDINIARELTYGSVEEESKFVQLLMARGVSYANIKKCVRVAEQQKGLVIGFSLDVLRKFPVEDREVHGDAGWKIVTNGSGLPFHYIYGIKAVGKRESDFLRGL